MSLSSDFQKLEVDKLIRLYELDARSLGGGILRFHGHISFEGWEMIYVTVDTTLITADTTKISADKLYDVGNTKVWKRNIIWQDQVFEPMALEVSGLEMRTDGKASTPTLSMANNINDIQNAVSAYCLQLQDFVGAKLTVITTTAEYLDAINFSGGNPSAANESENQHWYVEQKTSENAQAVTFELSNPIDFQGQRIPTRQITSMCSWAIDGYRGEQCQYMGGRMFTDKNEPTDNPALDCCSGYFSACRVRDNESRFGGFPAASMLG